MTLTNSSEASIFRQDYRQNMEIWIREIFFLFYGAFFLCAMIYELAPGHAALYYLRQAAQAVYAPGLLFAAGCLMGLKDSSHPAFRKETLRKALYCYLVFLGMGFFLEVFILHHEAFSTLKDLLAVIRIPAVCSVFVTLCFLFIICAFFWKYIEYCLQHRYILILIASAGLLLLLVPEGILGYGLTGIFIGGDRYDCVPVAYYLFAFFGGALLSRNYLPGLFHRKILGFTGAVSVLSGILFVFHQKQPAIILIGIVFAYLALVISIVFLPLYQRCESAAIQIWDMAADTGNRIRQTARKNKHAGRALYYTGYCALFLVTAFFVFLPYMEQDRTLIWSVDGLGQYVPKALRFINYIPSVFHDIIHGNPDFQQYDFTSGLGSTVSISYEPVYWLYLLFKPSQIESAYSILIIIRYFLAGLSMSFMLRYYKKSSYSAYIGSMVYTFSGYAIYAGTKHGQFLAPMILLPVLVIAMEELITKKKWYLLTVTTAISLLSSYYFLYMNTIALGIYFVVRISCTKEYRNIKTFLTRGLIIIGSYCIGAAIGSITLFTSFGGYVGSSRSGNESVSSFLSTTPFFYRGQWIPDFFISFISDSYSPGLWLKIGIAPIAFLALVFVFTRKGKKELKPVFILLTILCIIPSAGYIFNGFSNVSNRWCYIYVAVITFIIAEYLDAFHELTAAETRIMTGITIFYGLIMFLSAKYRTNEVFGAFGLLTMTLVFILLLNNEQLGIPKKTGKQLLFGITLFSLIMNANLFITDESGKNTHLSTYVAKDTAMTHMSTTALRYLDDAVADKEEDGFYRSTNLLTYGNNRSSSLIFGYNDISTFTSTLNGNIVNYNNQMGNCDHNVVSVYSYNFRTYLNELACVRYMGTNQKIHLPLPYGYKEIFRQETDNNIYMIYENEYALPLGYTYSDVVSEKDAEKYTAAQKQELSMLSAIVSDADSQKDANIGINKKPGLSVHELSITSTDMNNITMENGLIKIGEGGGSLTFHFDGEQASETYLSFQGDIVFPKDGAEHFSACDISAADVEYSHKFRVDAYSTGQKEYLFNLGYHEDAIDSCTLHFRSAATLTYEDIRIYSQSMEAYKKQVSMLQKDVLKNVKAENNTVTGSISTTQDKLLVIALPYQNGWTAYIDGKKTELQRVNYQYMGINLPAGDHEIRLHYQLPGLKLAFLFTSAGLILFLLIILFKNIRGKK